jgi:predicted TPR repeat methyltransferase
LSDPLTAARRLKFALACLGERDFAAAAEAAAAAAVANPAQPEPWFVLGEARQGAGDAPAAALASRSYLEREPADRLGAILRLALLGAAPLPAAPPPAYLQALFQEYAPRFDRALTEALAYRGPTLLGEALAGRRFRRALDLGCGTGLLAPVLRPLAERLEGVDLSGGMLARARGRGLYDSLTAADAVQHLAAQPAAGFDLLAAADLFPYLGDLAPLLREAARVLAPGGLLAATLERHEGPSDYDLAPTQRFRHAPDHLLRLLSGMELRCLSLEAVSIRLEAGQPVPGLVLLAEK